MHGYRTYRHGALKHLAFYQRNINVQTIGVSKRVQNLCVTKIPPRDLIHFSFLPSIFYENIFSSTFSNHLQKIKKTKVNILQTEFPQYSSIDMFKLKFHCVHFIHFTIFDLKNKLRSIPTLHLILLKLLFRCYHTMFFYHSNCCVNGNRFIR